MAAQAKYTVMIPQKDNLGNDLGDVASAAHHWLFYAPKGPKVEASFIHRNIDGNWRDDPQETFDHLVTFAEDHPEMDSHVKQLAAHVGQATNQWGVFVMKEGKNGPQSWVIPNNDYAHGAPAELAQQAAPKPLSKTFLASYPL